MEKSFASRLREAREASGLTQAELAWETHIQASTLSHYETAGREPNLTNLRLLCLALGVSADQLLGLHDGLENRMTMLEARMGSLEGELTDASTPYMSVL